MRSYNGCRVRPFVVSALTISRLPAGMFAAIAFSTNRHGCLVTALIAYLLMADLLDGVLARRWSVTTQAGAILDYVIDRFNYYLMMFLLIHAGVSPFLLVPFLLRDLIYVSVQVYIGMPSIRGTKTIGFIGTAAVYLYLLTLNYFHTHSRSLDVLLFLSLTGSLTSLILRVIHLRYHLLDELKRDLIL
jgi:phosphatidylglycerophosphate synthase